MVSVPARVWPFERRVCAREVYHLLAPGGVVEDAEALESNDRASFAFRRVLPEEEEAGGALREERGSDRGDGGTNVRITSYFATLEQLEQLVEMGMEEGLQLAMGQMDAILLDA